MNKILSSQEATVLSRRLRSENKTIVLAGGCFDVLHIGHIAFLEKAKEQGDVLLLLLESDEAITQMKGKNRPLNTQQDRALLLSALTPVDYVLPLSGILSDEDYDELILAIKPAIIATTQNDSNRSHKERQATRVGAKVIDVTGAIQNQSTTRIAQLLQRDI
ncbi:MAG: adenylyltransferase/cytidyltransferase family protein [Candidatus Levybacteria bacterium]|nr:adenylyltransferase/cytidyltransferase family protein [Candidatus Levybacteria bacterium]